MASTSEGILITIGAKVEDAVANVKKVKDGIRELGPASTDAVKELDASLDRMEAAFNAKWNPVVEKAEKSVITLSKQVAAFGGGVSSFKPAEYFKKTGDAAIAAGAAIVKGTGRANSALTDLSRIAQDAPFGFIAIQNNISPLIESFGRLKTETGSTGGALKAMLSGLTGPAGIGVAVAVVTSILTVFAQHMGHTKDEVDKNKESLDNFNKSLKDAEAQGLATGAKLQTFVDIARDGQLPMEQRNYALREANKILGEHGEKLTMVNISTKAVTDEINNFTKALIQQSLASKFADRVADLMIKQKDAAKDYGKALKDYTEQAKFAAEAGSVALSGGSGGVGGLGNINATQNAIGALKTLTGATTSYKNVTKELQEVYGMLNASQREATELMGDLGVKEKEHHAKRKKRIKELKDPLDKAPDRTGIFTMREGATATPDIASALPSQNDHLSILDQIIAKQKEAAKGIQDYRNGIVDMGKSLVGTFENVFTELISGGGNAMKVFAQFIQTVIMKLIAAAAVAAILSALTGGFGGGAKGGGFASIFSKIAGIPKFADGGIVSKPTLAMVGEGGESEAIIPMSKLNNLMNSTGGGEFTLRASGDDLVAVLNRTRARQGRSYGG
jgi:hypothetical protein